jgi:non-specific protein-tyrosine kinase
MDQQVANITGQIAAIEQQVAAAATQTSAVATHAAQAATQTSVAATQTSAVANQTAEAATQTSVAETQTSGVANQTAEAMTQTLSAPIAGPAASPQIAASQTSEAATQATGGVGLTFPSAVAPPVATPNSAALDQLQARLTQYRTIYSGLVTSYEQVRLSEDQTSTNVVISEPAVVSTIPVKPKTTQNTVLAAVAGMLLATGAAFAIETLDDTIKNPEEIRRKFNLPILGMIAWHETSEDRPIALAEPRSPTAEAFRSLRTNITYATVDRPLRRLMFTSPTPQDGKTTVACNLAVVLAQSDKNVVLIDADLRRPQVHRKFGLPNRLGLSELFVHPLDSLANALNASALANLAVLTSGGLPPNPSELLTSKLIGQILAKLDETFDIIVIDTPPVLTVTDAAALAPAMDGVVVVVKPGTTKVAALQETLTQLRAVNARVLGVVLNDVNPGSRKYGYYYNRYYSKY